MCEVQKNVGNDHDCMKCKTIVHMMQWHYINILKYYFDIIFVHIWGGEYLEIFSILKNTKCFAARATMLIWKLQKKIITNSVSHNVFSLRDQFSFIFVFLKINSFISFIKKSFSKYYHTTWYLPFLFLFSNQFSIVWK